MNFTPHQWQGHHFELSAERFIYWGKEKTIILSDLHLGKTGHFRKEGIAMPQQVFKDDLQRLFNAIQILKPNRILVVGDMVHSRHNLELDWFSRWRNDFLQTQFLLIKGNHDVLTNDWYLQNNIEVFDELKLDNLLFIHDASTASVNCQLPTVSGHVHPGIRINGAGKQTMHLPCFYFSTTQMLLPAYSKFTGLFTIKPKPTDSFFAIVNDVLINR